MTKLKSRIFFVSILVILLVAVLVCWQFNDRNGDVTKTVELRDVMILKEMWPPFSYVLQGKDGLRIPLAGNFPPMEKNGKESMHFDVVSVTIEIAKYDQRDYYTKMRLEKERIDRTLGINTKFFQYLNGVPGSDFNWYVQITKIVADGQDDELGGTLGKHDIRIFKWWSKLLNSER